MGVLRGALASLVLVCVLVACDDAPEPKLQDDPTPSVSPSSEAPSISAPTEETSSPSAPVEPEMPADALERSDRGAEAFLGYFVAQFNYAQITGRTGALAAASAPECVACQSYVANINEIYAGGGSVEGGALSYAEVDKLPLDYGAEWAGFSHARSTPQVIRHGDGSKEEFPGGKLLLFVYTNWDGAQWRMRFIKAPTPQ